MNINYDTLKLMGKFALFMIGILLMVYLVALITPWLAKKIDAKRGNPERVDKNSRYSFQKDELKSIYEMDSKDKNDDKEVNENGKE